jgi:DNA-binding response OmpR family regulator
MNRQTSAGQAPSNQAMLVLFQQGADGVRRTTGQHWLILEHTTTIGRDEDNDIVVQDRWISRRHALVRREGATYLLEDMGSKNGLFLNGRRVIEPTALQNDDRIQVSPRYELCFVDAEATAPLIQGQGDVLIDQDGCRVWVKGQELDPPLSSAQFALLQFLVSTPDRVHARDVLRSVAYPDEDPAGISDEAINSLVRRLRDRLTEIDPLHRYIYAVRGHGFKFQQPRQS